ncbi:MAG: hypothetical protein ABJC13_07255 [Acidobacteriota bacterium]
MNQPSDGLRFVLPEHKGQLVEVVVALFDDGLASRASFVHDGV